MKTPALQFLKAANNYGHGVDFFWTIGHLNLKWFTVTFLWIYWYKKNKFSNPSYTIYLNLISERQVNLHTCIFSMYSSVDTLVTVLENSL